MGKKMFFNSKAEEGKARKSMVQSESKEREGLKKEEQHWREAEGGNKSRAPRKNDEEAKKRAEAAARKAENRKLAELEEKELENDMKKPNKKANRVSIPVVRVTQVELRKWREEEQAAKQKRKTRTAAEQEYARTVLVKNTNRDDSIIEARTVEDAIAHVTVAYSLPTVYRHPQRRLKPRLRECFIR